MLPAHVTARHPTQEDLTSSREQLADRSQRLASLKEQYDKQLLETQASAKTQQAAAHEERIREKGQLREQLERCAAATAAHAHAAAAVPPAMQ
jgi:DNA repair exonuclease SbcCD ATPase subunit